MQALQIQLQEGKKLYFASDFHLGSPDRNTSREREDRILSWLQQAETDMGGLFLLGDIFDYWFEYKYYIPKTGTRLLARVAQIADKGIPVYFFWGNHDAWTKDYFEKELGWHTVCALAEIRVNGKKIIAGHGDGLGPGQRGYKLMKRIFNAGWARSLFASLPPSWAYRIATGWSNNSRKSGSNKPRYHSGEPLLQYMREFLKTQHTDGFVFGHRHFPEQVELENGTVYVNTGDWLHHNTYATYNGTSLQLWKFSK